jgi:cell wall-associated NlpC family hydrolase
VLGALRLEVPRTAHEQSKLGREVARDTAQLRPGDLLTFGTKRRITHIGIYAGNGQVIHASTSRRRVIETSLSSLGPSLLRNWRSARRLIDVVDEVPEGQ